MARKLTEPPKAGGQGPPNEGDGQALTNATTALREECRVAFEVKKNQWGRLLVRAVVLIGSLLPPGFVKTPASWITTMAPHPAGRWPTRRLSMRKLKPPPLSSGWAIREMWAEAQTLPRPGLQSEIDSGSLSSAMAKPTAQQVPKLQHWQEAIPGRPSEAQPSAAVAPKQQQRLGLRRPAQIAAARVQTEPRNIREFEPKVQSHSANAPFKKREHDHVESTVGHLVDDLRPKLLCHHPLDAASTTGCTDGTP